MKVLHKLLILSFLLTTAWAQYPADWNVDVHAFEHTMTVTGELIINDLLQAEASSAVAAFHNDACRGVIEGTLVGEEMLYFLMIYGNLAGDSLEFRAWDAATGNIVLLDQRVTFSSGTALGDVAVPYPLSGTNTVSFIQAFDDSFEQAEDTDNLLPLDILENDAYDRSLPMVVTFLVEPLHGSLFENVDQTFSYASDLNFFGQDSFHYQVSHEYGSDSAWAQIAITPVDDPLAEFHLLGPENNSLFEQGASSIQTFTWEIPEDYDGDPISYSLYVYDGETLDSSYSSDVNSFSVDLEHHTRNTWLDWYVIAFDGWGWTASTDTFSIQISSLVDIHSTLQRPSSFYVGQNYPNPFNPSTLIDFALPASARVSLNIYDARGNQVFELHDQSFNAGLHHYTWNGMNQHGEAVESGLYFCQVKVGEQIRTIKMLLLR